MSRIELRAITKVYPDGPVAVDGVDLEVDDGEVLVLLGPTGSGKSSVLRLIAGLEQPTSGEILFDGVDVAGVGAGERHVAMVFQDYALYPHLTVAENIGFPLRHLDESTREARTAEVAGMLGLTGVLGRRPAHLSGGQRQRVSMARAIARPPRAFLLDQPLSSLDSGARDEVRTTVLHLARTLRVATVYVTHDHEEAMLIGDRVAVLRRGRIEQIGTPEEVYSEPERLFVAAFVGSPRMNLIQAAVYAEAGVRIVIDLGSQTLDLPWDTPLAALLALHDTSRITIGIRPDALRPTTDTDTGHTLTGIVRLVELRGPDVLVHLETGIAPTPHLLSHLELPDAPGQLAQAAGDTLPRPHPVRDRLSRFIPRQRTEGPVRYAVQPAYDARQDVARHTLGDLLVRMPAAPALRSPATSEDAALGPGDTVHVAVDVDQLYLFDREGVRIWPPRRPEVARRPEVEGPDAGAIADMTAA